MKKLLKYIVPVALVALTLLMAGCTGDTNNTTTTQAAINNSFSAKASYQGALFDAVTGKRIVDPSVRCVMVRGSAIVDANFVSDATNPAAGEYSFNDVPITATAGNYSFRIVVAAPGYQRFEAEVPSNIVAIAGNNTIDTDYNFIGDVYLFPVGATASDYTVKVRYNGAAVPGATVQLNQNTTNNTLIAQSGANAPGSRLNPSAGLLPVLSATTDANGNAVFSGASLVLGGNYTAVVLPAVATANAATGMQADQLEQKFGAIFTVGAPIAGNVLGTEQTIAMTGANNNDSVLAITKISNSTAGILADAGNLIITFNRPVTINNNNRPVATTTIDNATGLAPTAASTNITTTNTVYGFGATIASSSLLTTAKLTAFGATADIRPVVATLDATRTILTLTPKFSVAKAGGDFDLRITYFDTPQAANLPAPVITATATVPVVTTTVAFVAGAANAAASVSPLDKPEAQFGIFAANPTTGNQVPLRSGVAISPIVRITAPAPGL
jgi:hypothetical protein